MSIKLLANENIPGVSIALLQKAGFDVLAAAHKFQGSPDETVLSGRNHKFCQGFDPPFEKGGRGGICRTATDGKIPLHPPFPKGEK